MRPNDLTLGTFDTLRQVGTAGAGFLSRYRALDLTDERGLLAGAMFGRLGADVIQVEPPGGSPARDVPPFAQDAPPGENSLYWSAYASMKRGITCALDRPEGRSLLHRLVAVADVLFESEGAALHPELRFDTLKGINPRLVHVTITPFGSNGPKAQFADTDLIAWAAAGPLWPNRDDHGKPLRISAPQAYLHAAADAASGALIALLARNKTGSGQHVDISAQQSASVATMSASLAAAIGHENYSFDSPSFKEEPHMSATRRRLSKWRAKDGLVQMYLYMGSEGRFSNKLFDWMRRQGAVPPAVAEWDWNELPKLIDDGRVSERQVDEARAAVAACFARYTKREIIEIAVAEGIPMAPALTVADVRQGAHFNARGCFETVEESGRPRTLPGRLALTSIPSHAGLRPAPRLGEHNEDVYRTHLRLEPEDIARLKKEGVI
ncbi:CoA transferase [Bradyrhizobium sp. 174]|uniref:CoA transferase n=1 Tax=Bradyrhizobium sp. 174 TaxID=2782645 RepID=UPI001FF9BE2B|nr:CoA transferase [Bradyrhizobium sp. 174]MCK1574181.1 CoA transferase [Bradyrhizobium sp. 174]